MAEKESNSKQWSDPKDFGLPFVEITPLVALKGKNKGVRKEIPTATEPLINTTESIPDKKKSSPPPVIRTSPPSSPKKSNRAWIWIVTLGFIVTCSSIVWQLGLLDSLTRGVEATQQENSLASSASDLQSEAPVSVPLPVLDSLPTQDSSFQVSATLNTEDIDTGTPIVSSPTIIRIENVAQRRRYFVVIGSFGSEDEAMRFIQKAGNDYQEYYLVYPYESSKNYRLAIGSYTNWTEASERLEQLKAENSKGYWILNY